MAAPANITIGDLSGRWRMSATLSDPYDNMLKAQDVSWLWRKVLSKSGAELHIDHSVDDEGLERLTVRGRSSVSGGGLPETVERRILDGKARELNFPIFGHIRGVTRWARAADVPSPWLVKGLLLQDDDRVMLMETTQIDIGTFTVQANGFEMVKGERRYVRHVEVTSKKKEHIRVRLVYDYLGPLQRD